MINRSKMRLAVLAASLPAILLLSSPRGDAAEPASIGTERESAVEALSIYLPLVARNYDPLLIFFDAFSDPGSGWFIDLDDPNISWSYQDGEYEMLLLFEGWWAGATAPAHAQFNYFVESDIRRQTGNESDYGLIFDFVDWDNFTFFSIDPGKQLFGVVKVKTDSPGFEVLVPATFSTYIKPNNDTNRLRVERKGTEIQGQLLFYANDQLLATVNSCTRLGKGMGVYAESDSDAPASVRYDNYLVKRIDTGLPTQEGKIAFRRYEGGNYEIYTMNADGTGQTNLTNHPGGDDYPSWSPDGSKIAFVSSRDGNGEIYVMNADGTGVMRLTNNTKTDGNPAWSPDGSKIAFSRFDSNYDIWVMNAGGGGEVQLTTNPFEDIEPAWSPDSARIAFRSQRDGNMEIYVMNDDGTGQTNITMHPAHDEEPDWSPDGSKIVFSSSRDGFAIWTMNSDGSAPTKLTSTTQGDSNPAWSSDGLKIAFRSYRDFIHEIYVMAADGSCQTRLTDTSAENWWPDWQPPSIFTSASLVQIERQQSKSSSGDGSALSQGEGH